MIHLSKRTRQSMFEHETAYGDFKDLTRKTASETILHDRPFNIAKNPTYVWYQRSLVSLIYK